MTDMVEIVAQKISMKLYGGYPVDGNNSREVMAQWESTKELARAVIEAMRKATEEMIDAGMDANPRGRTITDSDLRIMFSAMISSAIKEHEDKSAMRGEEGEKA